MLNLSEAFTISTFVSCIFIIYLPFIFFSNLCRYLKFLGYEVEYVRNFTDIDDKVITCPVQFCLYHSSMRGELSYLCWKVSSVVNYFYRPISFLVLPFILPNKRGRVFFFLHQKITVTCRIILFLLHGCMFHYDLRFRKWSLQQPFFCGF